MAVKKACWRQAIPGCKMPRGNRKDLAARTAENRRPVHNTLHLV